MGANFYGELIVRYTADTTSLTNAQRQLAASTAASSKAVQKTWTQTAAKTGLAMQNVGRTFTQYFSLPVAAGLGYAAYSAYNYQKAMLQVKNLTGLTAQEANKFSDAIREASAEIGNTGGPQAAAEAYYFLASSGLNAKEAFDALKVTMKANVAGMGDIQVTADVVSSAMNVYRDSGMDATKAMDILMRTIEVGKAEPEALASSLGRIMPIANQLGVGLAELGGNVAALTLGGLSSAEAVTSLRGSMVALVSPAKMSIDQLKELGTSYQEVTASIRDKGLLPTLKMLWDLTDHNMLTMRKIIPNVRATAGVMSLLGDNYEKNLEVIGKVGDSQGKLNETYRTAAESDVAKFNKALNELKSTFIEVGAVVLPVITDMIEAFGDLIEKFEELSETKQKMVIIGAVGMAALFPLLSIVGSLTRGLAMLSMSRAAATIAGVGTAAQTSAAQVASLQAVSGGGSAAASVAAGGGIKAAMAGMAAYVPAAAIAAGVSYAIVKGIEKAAETDGSAWDKIAAGAEEAFYMGHIFDKGGPLESVGQFIEDLKGDIAEPFVNIFGHPTEGAAAFNNALEAAEERLKSYGESSTVAAMQSGYLADDLKRMGELGMEKIMPDFTLDASFKQVRAWRKNIMRELGVGKDEAQAILDLWFQPGRGWNVPVKSMKSIDGITERIKGLRAEADRRLAFNINDPSVKKIESTIDRLEVRLRRLRRQGGIEFKDVKPPKIDASGSMGKFKRQIDQMEVWLGALGRTRTIPVEIRKQKAKKAVEEIETQLNQVKARIKRTGITPELSAKKKKLEDALKIANDELDALGKREESPVIGLDMTAFDAGILHVMGQLAAIPDAVNIQVTTSETPIGQDAWGGIYKKPRVTLVGEEGPEVIIPLTKPKRAAQLLAASGLNKYIEQRPMVAAVKQEQAVAAPGGPAEVHYHSHMNLPQGVVVSDIERFGRTVQPYVERGTLLAERRRRRGRPRL